MRNYEEELEKRVEFIRCVLQNSGAKGIVFGNSGGKDSALVGILCKKACDNVLSVIMPCQSTRNFGEDKDDATKLAEQFGIDSITVNLSNVKSELLNAIESNAQVTDAAKSNIAPRLRMATLYAVAQSRGALVVGTGNKSERFMGYFTKWGDGANDFNPISDLTVTEIYEFLEYLNAPENIIKKAPSAGLFEGQTDEKEMGVTYKEIDTYMAGGQVSEDAKEKIERAHRITEHKRIPITVYEK